MNEHLEGLLKGLEEQTNKGFGNGQIKDLIGNTQKLLGELSKIQNSVNKQIKVEVISRSVFGKKSFTSYWKSERVLNSDQVNVKGDSIEIVEGGKITEIEYNQEVINIINGTA